MSLYQSGRVLVLLLITAVASAGFSASAATTNYAGLIYSGNPNTAAQSGIFVMSVSPSQKFSGRMLVGQRSAGFSGQFDTNGVADIVVKITIDNSCYSCEPPIIDKDKKKFWDAHFQLSLDGDSISGGLHFRHGDFPDGTLAAKRSSFSRANEFPSEGNFTFVLAGSDDPASTNFPTGNCFGMIDIDSFGSVGLSGSLADKATFSLGTLLCDDGTFPVYVSSDNGEMIQGWMGLTNSPDADLIGDVFWTKPKFVRRAFYPAGFTNEVAVVGSRYVRTNPVLDWTNGVVIFQGGKLDFAFTNNVLLNAKSRIANTSDNKLTLKIQSKSGFFSGRVKEPSTGDQISFMGVMLQKANGGFGYFPDAPLSGQVMLGPAAP